MNTNPDLLYRQELNKHQEILQKLIAKKKRLAWTRALVFIVTAIVAWIIFSEKGWLGTLPLTGGLGLLLYLVNIDIENNKKIARQEILVLINEQELLALKDKYDFRDNGAVYMPKNHNYAEDLDLFGDHSLFQMINRCYSVPGKNLLAKLLSQPLLLSDKQQMQIAIKACAGNISWRQNFQALSMQTSVTATTQHKLIHWIQEPEKSFTAPYIPAALNLYSFIMLSIAVASLFGWISPASFSFMFFISLGFANIIGKYAAKAYGQLSQLAPEISTLELLFQQIEYQDFSSAIWQQMKKNNGEAVSIKLKQLQTILNRFDLRLNLFISIFINSFLLWDIRQLVALNQWRKKNKLGIETWFDTIAQAEVINSLTVLHFNQPAWTFPQFSGEYFIFRGKDLGHPLIESHLRITNDFILEGHPKIALITGSNMAGKSTFLRSLGVNMVLAGIGAPVCATQLLVAEAELISSMRITDNLAENTSTFYAELKKLKNIIEQVNLHKPVFILLDEILRGTNSLDRHTGSKAMIAQLVRSGAVAVIATHDLELAEASQEIKNFIENYHFDVQVENEELYFDYRLKKGVCQSMNASLLMKKIGIEL